MTTDTPYIVGFGIACIDYIYVAPAAQPGGYSRVSEYMVQGGGLTGTAMVAAARLGAKARMLGRLGDDDIGDQVVQGLEAEGVDTGGLIRVPGGESLFSMILVDTDTAERTIYGRVDTGTDCSTDLINLTALEGADVLLLDHHWADGSRTAARRARELGIPIVCDMFIRPELMDLLAMCDHPVIPRKSAIKLSESADVCEALAKIRSFGPKAAVVTCGADGAYYADESGQGHVEAFEVEAVDTTGAGDTFHGAFAVGLAHGWDLRKAVTFASAVSAIKCTRVGGRTGIPSFEQAMEFLRERGATGFRPCE